MRSWSFSSLSTVALLVLSQPQPPDFAWVGDSVVGELRSRLDDDVIEFRKRSVDLAATVGDAVATLYAQELKSRLPHCLQTPGFWRLVFK
ncbi:hypothetical protein [Nostoc sp.]|uniref:hypothetical protein n=1 Tax=Nostoc sp. TaxID=1180 RepID=UPI002FFAF4CF